MPRALDIQSLIGSRSGRLTLVGQGDPIHTKTSNTRAVLCKCDCGTVVHIHLISFTRGNSKSCGCARRESLRKRNERNKKHGKSCTKEYRSWSGMIRRASGKIDKKLYFDRGIGVCERWLSFENFYEDMGDCPEGFSIDRIDNDKGYSPENCRWASNYVQSRNRRNNVWVEFQGKRMCLTDAARAAGLTQSRLTQRMQAGMKDIFAPLQVQNITKAHRKRLKEVPSLDAQDEEFEFS